MAVRKPKDNTIKRYSLEEFYQISENSTERLEYVDGLIIAMAEPTPRHSKIQSNLHSSISALLQQPCWILVERSVLIPSHNNYSKVRRPDAIIICNFETAQYNYLKNPKVIFEVLSPSNRSEETTKLLTEYLKIESVTDVFFISQTEIYISHYKRLNNQHSINYYDELEAIIELESLGISFRVKDIYKNINLDEKEG